MVALPQRVRAQAAYTLGHLSTYLCKVRALGGGEEEHVQSLLFEADLLQQSLYIIYAALGSQITFQVMAGAFQSTSDEDAIHAPLESAEQVDDVRLAAAG